MVNLDAYNVYSATNVRLQEASLGYTFPNSWFKGTPFHSVNLSVYGTNLWMIYNKAPFDPELTASTRLSVRLRSARPAPPRNRC